MDLAWSREANFSNLELESRVCWISFVAEDVMRLGNFPDECCFAIAGCHVFADPVNAVEQTAAVTIMN